MAENFDLIFGQSASSQYAWNDSDYQNGWETVGSTPPTAEQFDALQRRSDMKAQELNNALTPLVNQNMASNRQPVTAYVEKDIRYSTLLPTGWYLECSTAGISGSGDITLPSPLVENAVITDGTVTWKIRRISSADGVGIGIILPFAGNGAIPSGYLLCDGAAYSRTAFPDLFACIGTDYGAGDGSTTFNVPDANQAKRFLQGDTVAGQTKAAGLPNITGTSGVRFIGNNYKSASGALKWWDTTSEQSGVSSGNASLPTGGVQMNASWSNPIYGNSTTVQPPALTTRYIIKAFDGQTADSALIDITQYENELGNKADRSLSNLTDAGKSFSFPSDTYVDISSYVNSGTNYIAPADGYIYLGGRNASGNNAYVLIYNNSTILEFSDQRSAANAYPNAFVPAKKGQSFNLSISSDASGDRIARFFYASGEVPA